MKKKKVSWVNHWRKLWQWPARSEMAGEHIMRRKGTLPLLFLPGLLIASTWSVFSVAVNLSGKEAGYLVGFVFYWLVWCLAIPILVLGKQAAIGLLKGQDRLFSRRNLPAALLWVVVITVAVFMYWSGFVSAPPPLILIAIPMAAINGICEEILWRGLYVKEFPNDPWLGVVFPALGFALWHFSPQTVIPAENQFGFVLSTLFLGLAYGFIAYRTGSAKWSALSHSLNGMLALASPMANIILALLGG
jgi:membrane protease YdiL (CAAX protease family)